MPSTYSRLDKLKNRSVTVKGKGDNPCLVWTDGPQELSSNSFKLTRGRSGAAVLRVPEDRSVLHYWPGQCTVYRVCQRC